MDFDLAAQRLQKDQRSAVAKSRASRANRQASAKSRREAQAARNRAEKRLKEKQLAAERSSKIVDVIERSIGLVERRELGISNLQQCDVNADEREASMFKSVPLAKGMEFRATSIHGEGDKIALPPSILESMMSSSSGSPWGNGISGRPIAFRIGVLNPDYKQFPSSEKMKSLVERVERRVIETERTLLESQAPAPLDHAAMDVDEDDDETVVQGYLDELRHRYLAYTHGTVVEFTQEEGCVGLPEPIARALCQPNMHSLTRGEFKRVPVKRTVDPAPAMEDSEVDAETSSSEKTPGHPAYGLFDVPDLPVEIIPISSLPPGGSCTFTPTAQSVKNGFYSLKDIKAVLEQSLMRTRATLSLGDVVRTWRRGVEFDLIVSSLSPARYGTVSCVNTDLNVDIGPAEGTEKEGVEEKPSKAETVDSCQGSGRVLSAPSPRSSRSPALDAPASHMCDLPPEPPIDAKEGVCTIQIRSSSGAAKRRFDTSTATADNLFDFASSVCGKGKTSFRLVTRFPRRVFELVDGSVTLKCIGLDEGQEMFMVEMR
ncbi:hypothetical protein THAOC_15601 [Thalassiosira oceanica]|uniref:UBX domain-containing protein n=1 Tax=Thalassiosira oceanica TaxID=159749 RepID=K0SCE0_THAOC|nr:hypothetical protein THAOC_15601 [Thalassiosira oceanica]|eukprot:EJK63723.1 hypothetical protein THAOC_15601 [Thalassiosira oceanica]